jgi:hypothetical protein
MDEEQRWCHAIRAASFARLSWIAQLTAVRGLSGTETGLTLLRFDAALHAALADAAQDLADASRRGTSQGGLSLVTATLEAEICVLTHVRTLVDEHILLAATDAQAANDTTLFGQLRLMFSPLSIITDR